MIKIELTEKEIINIWSALCGQRVRFQNEEMPITDSLIEKFTELVTDFPFPL